ncbi:MAG: class I SAM-dependent methyltransferase, partial [Pseudomonadales bacterium]
MPNSVDSDRYNEEWIACAWGEDNIQELLAEGELQPRPRVARALELCDLKPGLAMLDIACGRGEVPAIAAEKGLFSVGIDYSFTILDMANQVRSKRSDAHAGQFDMSIVQTDACTLPFQADSFDRITMLDIVEHLTPGQLRLMFAEVKRLLKPGGYAVVHTLPNRWVYDIGYKWFRHINHKLPTQPRSEIEQQVHINEQDIVGLSNMLGQCGLHREVWLEQFIPAQARWQSSKKGLSDNRGTMYPMLAGG